MRYELKSPRWYLILEPETGYRSCSLYDGSQELDPFEESDLDKIHQILPELMNAVRAAFRVWDNTSLYDRHIWPEILLYAERQQLTVECFNYGTRRYLLN